MKIKLPDYFTATESMSGMSNRSIIKHTGDTQYCGWDIIQILADYNNMAVGAFGKLVDADICLHSILLDTDKLCM